MKRVLLLLAVLALLVSSCGKTPPSPSRQDDLPATVVALHPPRAIAGVAPTARVPFRTPTPDPTRNLPPQPTEVYLIQRGDTLGQVALEYGTTPEELIAMNGLSNPNQIEAGQIRKIAGENLLGGLVNQQRIYRAAKMQGLDGTGIGHEVVRTGGVIQRHDGG
jgi:LysM repeat protein